MWWFRVACLAVVLQGMGIPCGGLTPAQASESRLAQLNSLWQGLDLTPAQQQQVQDLRQRFMPQMRSLRQSLHTSQHELRNLQTNGGTAEQIQSRQSQISRLKQQMASVRREYSSNLKNILTPQQWEKLQQRKRQQRGASGDD